MKLWTSQSAAAWDELQSKGVLRAPFSVTSAAGPDNSNFLFAYEWMRKQMIARGLIPPVDEPVLYPLWAWADCAVAYQHWTRYKRRSKFWNENNVFLEIEIPDSQVLLSDYEIWHIVLNGEHSTEEERQEWPRLVLDLDWRDPDWRSDTFTTQATFWELRLDQVQVIEKRPRLK